MAACDLHFIRFFGCIIHLCAFLLYKGILAGSDFHQEDVIATKTTFDGVRLLVSTDLRWYGL